MRAAIKHSYDGAWPQKVAKMPDKQVVSIYMRLLNTNPARLNTGVKK